MATLTFRIHYATQWGEHLEWETSPTRGASSESPLPASQLMHYEGEGFWTLSLELDPADTDLAYRYVLVTLEGERRSEPLYRRLESVDGTQAVFDQWFAPEWPDAAFLRQAFPGIIFRTPVHAPHRTPAPGGRRLRLSVRAPRLPHGQPLCVSGSHPLLGSWDPARARPLRSDRYPLWELDLPAEAFGGGVEFKFGAWNTESSCLTQFETGPNRRLPSPLPAADQVIVHCEHFGHVSTWKGAGVAIPVFSLRTESGYGIGEFVDLAPLAEWAASCDLQMIQLLPVSDTSTDFSWRDSYPYKAISTSALHPVYLNVERVYRGYRAPLPEGYSTRREALNQLPHLDYETVLKDKLNDLRALYTRVVKSALSRREFRQYLREQAAWLEPYAGFCRLRDLHGTADFTRWGDHAAYAPDKIAGWFKPDAPEYRDVMFHCWLQFHLDRQLSEAIGAGHDRGVAFKGDLPIGIDRHSVEAWTEPQWFRMDRQTGAPPDAFAKLGQNWGFPTYHWPRMEADGYAWWRRRFHRMSGAFDALRVDHILGFFRIWEIPQPYDEGIMGHYNPTLPLSAEEIHAAGFTRDPHQFTTGKTIASALTGFFGESASTVADELLEQDAEGYFQLRRTYATADARAAWYAGHALEPVAARIEEGLKQLSFEVLFLEDPDQPGRFHPRINLHETSLFQGLPELEQSALRQLHEDYFHVRHSRHWEAEGMKKLPALMDATPMLICGEDLGMVPDSVPIVLKRLGLLSLEVQRWPKIMGRRLSNPADYPYLSVCTTSTHDMTTLRGWWEEDAETRQYFWTEVMARGGPAPAACSTEIARFILEQNLSAASMWCILPLQDWLATSPNLRFPTAAAERINIPAQPRHYWRYRMHLTLESLAQADAFNSAVRQMVEASGRGRDT